MHSLVNLESVLYPKCIKEYWVFISVLSFKEDPQKICIVT